MGVMKILAPVMITSTHTYTHKPATRLARTKTHTHARTTKGLITVTP